MKLALTLNYSIEYGIHSRLFCIHLLQLQNILCSTKSVRDFIKFLKMVGLFYFTIKKDNCRSHKFYVMVPFFDTESEIKVLKFLKVRRSISALE